MPSGESCLGVESAEWRTLGQGGQWLSNGLRTDNGGQESVKKLQACAHALLPQYDAYLADRPPISLREDEVVAAFEQQLEQNSRAAQAREYSQAAS